MKSSFKIFFIFVIHITLYQRIFSQDIDVSDSLRKEIETKIKNSFGDRFEVGEIVDVNRISKKKILLIFI